MSILQLIKYSNSQEQAEGYVQLGPGSFTPKSLIHSFSIFWSASEVRGCECCGSRLSHFKNFPTQTQLKFLSNWFCFILFWVIHYCFKKTGKRGGLVWRWGRGRGWWRRSGIYTVNTSPNCTVVLLEDNTEVQVRGFGLVHPFHNPSPKSPQAKLCRASHPVASQGQDPHNLSAPSGLVTLLPLLQTLRAAYHAEVLPRGTDLE